MSGPEAVSQMSAQLVTAPPLTQEVESVGFILPLLPDNCQKWGSWTLKTHKKAESRNACRSNGTVSPVLMSKDPTQTLLVCHGFLLRKPFKKTELLFMYMPIIFLKMNRTVFRYSFWNYTCVSLLTVGVKTLLKEFCFCH